MDITRGMVTFNDKKGFISNNNGNVWDLKLDA